MVLPKLGAGQYTLAFLSGSPGASMWRVSLVLIIGGIAGIVFGGHKVSVAMRNSSPVQMTYAEWCASKPDAEWLELSEVHIDWSASARIDTEHTRKGVTTHTTHDYYVACWTGTEDPNPVQAFLKVEDKGKQQLMEQCWNHENDDAWLLANINQVYEVQTVRGLVQTGLDLSSEDQRLLKGMGHVDGNFKIIELNKEPQGGFGAILLVLGLLGTGGGVGLFVLGRKKQPQPQYNLGQGHRPPPGAMPPAAPDAMPAGPRPAPRGPAPMQGGPRPATRGPVPPQGGTSPAPGAPRPPQAGPRPPQPRPPQAH